MQQADASPPEPAAAEAVQEQIAPTPPQEKPEVVAPPEQKVEMKPATRARQAGPGGQADAGQAKGGSPGGEEADRRAACAAHDGATQAERQAPAASAASAGASAAALASYRQMVAAHLQRFKQYPPAAKAAGQQGTSRVSFTLSRSGRCFPPASAARRAIRADAETLAMVRRAQPFPAFPRR